MFDYTRTKIRHFLKDLKHQCRYSHKKGKNRILIVQVEGLGNAILTTPLIQAIKEFNSEFTIDVLIDKNRSSEIVFKDWNYIEHIFDIRNTFINRHHYQYVFECHPRKELPEFIAYKKRYRIPVKPKPNLEYHWWFEKHESEYLLDMIRRLGFQGKRPPVRKFKGDLNHGLTVKPNSVAIGIGYFKGPRTEGKDWSGRHWGNANFLILCNELKNKRYHPVLVGDQQDYNSDGYLLEQQGVENICGKLTLAQVVGYLCKCVAFIGNDTGLMHVSAALNIPTIGIFVNSNSIKSYPLGNKSIALVGDIGEKYYNISPEIVMDNFIRMTKKYDNS